MDLYPLKAQDKFALALSSTLAEDDTPDDGTFDQSARKSIMDKFEYVMHGRVFKIGEDRSCVPPKAVVHASFGGLLSAQAGRG